MADCCLAAFGNAAERLVIRRLIFFDRRDVVEPVGALVFVVALFLVLLSGVGCVEVRRVVGVAVRAAVRAVVRPDDPWRRP